MSRPEPHPSIRLGQYQGTVGMIKARHEKVGKWNDAMLLGLLRSLFNLHDEIEREYFRVTPPDEL